MLYYILWMVVGGRNKSMFFLLIDILLLIVKKNAFKKNSYLQLLDYLIITFCEHLINIREVQLEREISWDIFCLFVIDILLIKK